MTKILTSCKDSASFGGFPFVDLLRSDWPTAVDLHSQVARRNIQMYINHYDDQGYGCATGLISV